MHYCGKFFSSQEADSCLQAAFDQLAEYESKTYAVVKEGHMMVSWITAVKDVVFAAKAPPATKSKIIYAIDVNPGNPDRFMFVSGVEVLDQTTCISRLDPSSLVIITNPNYEQEIRGSLPHNQPCRMFN